MDSEEYMNRKQQEAEIAEVSILILTVMTIYIKRERERERERENIKEVILTSKLHGGLPNCQCILTADG